MSNIKVISKYFPDRVVMDDSLSEFEEKKKFNTGPKHSKKSNKYTQNKIKKKVKCVKGQKDIRTLVKNKQSEIVSYSKDFDHICEQAGVDVDSEQLQLAIALSKSLIEVESLPGSNPHSSKCLTSQERALKIRTTLQEYGFKVPKTKINIDTNKRKKPRKQYKLLYISETERKQNISDKYAEVLAKNILRSPIKVSQAYSHQVSQEIYYKSSNISYELIKNDVVYYVENLFAKPSNKVCLLKDWSEIPGRPLSPKLEVNSINFETITCSQDDLDHILSGSVSTAQQIIKNKSIEKTFCNNSVDSNSMHVTVQLQWNKIDQSDEKQIFINTSNNIKNAMPSKGNSNTLIEMGSDMRNIVTVSQQIRGVSPDLFDEDVSINLDSNNTIAKSLEQIPLSNQTYHIDITECVNINRTCNDTNPKTNFKIYDTNVTKRESNDFMEITECAVTNSKQLSVEQVDLTYFYHVMNTNDMHVEQNENIDLTQASNSDDDLSLLEVGDIKNSNILDNTIILNNCMSGSIMPVQQKETLSKDYHKPICLDIEPDCETILREHCNKIETFVKENLSSSCKHKCKNSDVSYENKKRADNCVSKSIETIILDDGISVKSKISFSNEKQTKQDNSLYDVGFIKNFSPDSLVDQCNSNFYSENKRSYNKTSNSDGTRCYPESQPSEIDLIQSSDSSKDSMENKELKNSEIITDNLGKRDNVSIDYDEIFDVLIRESKTSRSETSLKISNYEINISKDEVRSIQGEDSKIFETPNKEFYSSFHKSSHDNLKLGENRIIADITDKISCSNDYLSDCILPVHNVKDKEIFQKQEVNPSNEISTPLRVSKENLIIRNIETPTNNDYEIKTNDVTPMRDYASMSSPERNKELEKYGLKPFKRKRAIQLLTYLYNQTHPLVESVDDCPSPSKRQKHDTSKQHESPKKYSNCPKHTSVDAVHDINKENDIYAVTKYFPDIKNIECNEEDWVFQTREKTKVHSCRVPLHITFHNYVSCRQKLREAILQYEPINIDIIQKDLIASGHRYNPKDLLKFLDKKCITVKTADNNPRNRKS